MILFFGFVAILTILAFLVCFRGKLKNTQKKVKIAPNQENKTTLYNKTFLLQNVEVVLFFLFGAIWTHFWVFFSFPLKVPKIAEKNG